MPMHRKRLRAAALILAVAVLVLLPPAARSLEPAAAVSPPAGERSFFAGFWQLLADLFQGQAATAACDTGILIDPDG